jgi:hypothetical protein
MKRHTFWFAAIVIASAMIGFDLAPRAQERTNTDYVMPLGYCQLTASGTAALISTCSGGIPARTVWAIVVVETANIRWRDDGTAPTASVGMPLGPTAAAAALTYSGTMSAFEIIAVSGSPVVNISFYSGAPRS